MNLYLLYDIKNNICIRTTSDNLQKKIVDKGVMSLCVVSGRDISVCENYWISTKCATNLTGKEWLKNEKEKEAKEKYENI